MWRDQNTSAGFFGLGRGPNGTGPLTKLLILYDDAGQGRLTLSVAEDGTPSIVMRDAAGNVTWRAQ